MHLLLAALVLTLPQAPAHQTTMPLEQILSPSQLRKFKAEDKYHDRVEILRKAFQQVAPRLAPLTHQTDLAPAYEVLRQLEALCETTAAVSAEEKDADELRHKEVKRLEIVVRKMLEELDDLKLLVTFNERQRYERTDEVLSKLREQLLQQLFEGSLGGSESALTHSWIGPAVAASMGPGTGQEALAGIDRFTLAEFEKIRLSRKLVDRTEAFLEICEARLTEIERRRQDLPWESDDPNPLELHSYGDMLHAYKRSMDSLMINIDEKAKLQAEEEKEIRKALETLNEKSLVFKPRLEALAELVREYKDLELGRQLRLAMKSNAQAVRGSQLGLGAPKQD